MVLAREKSKFMFGMQFLHTTNNLTFRGNFWGPHEGGSHQNKIFPGPRGVLGALRRGQKTAFPRLAGLGLHQGGGGKKEAWHQTQFAASRVRQHPICDAIPRDFS